MLKDRARTSSFNAILQKHVFSGLLLINIYKNICKSTVKNSKFTVYHSKRKTRKSKDNNLTSDQNSSLNQNELIQKVSLSRSKIVILDLNLFIKLTQRTRVSSKLSRIISWNRIPTISFVN